MALEVRMIDVPVIDCDVHYSQKTDRDIFNYLPKEWRDYAALPGDNQIVPFSTGYSSPLHGRPEGVNRLYAAPQEGGPPGSDYDTLR